MRATLPWMRVEIQSSKANVSEHIRNIYDQGELEQKATVRNFRTVRKEGNRMVNRTLTYYNLDAIISVGFRVNTKRGIMFRQWAKPFNTSEISKCYLFVSLVFLEYQMAINSCPIR